MLNHIVIMGRLVRDPELRFTQTGTPVVSFTVAVDRDYKPEGGERETDFIDCSAWRGTAEFISNYFHKGSMIVVSGRLQSRKWEDQEGKKHTGWDVKADSVYFGESRRAESTEARPAPGEYSSPFREISDEDGDMPF